MKVVTFAELVALPAGTIFCQLEGGFATNLYRKGESEPDHSGEGAAFGFWKTELLPQRVGLSLVPAWQPSTWWPSDYDDVGNPGVFYAFEEEDVEEFIARLRGGGGQG